MIYLGQNQNQSDAPRCPDMGWCYVSAVSAVGFFLMMVFGSRR